MAGGARAARQPSFQKALSPQTPSGTLPTKTPKTQVSWARGKDGGAQEQICTLSAQPAPTKVRTSRKAARKDKPSEKYKRNGEQAEAANQETEFKNCSSWGVMEM